MRWTGVRNGAAGIRMMLPRFLQVVPGTTVQVDEQEVAWQFLVADKRLDLRERAAAELRTHIERHARALFTVRPEAPASGSLTQEVRDPPWSPLVEVQLVDLA